MERNRKMSLTRGETAIIRLVARGLTDRAVAETLDLSPKTVHEYCHRLCLKTGCKNRVQLTRYAITHGLVPVYWEPEPLADEFVGKNPTIESPRQGV